VCEVCVAILCHMNANTNAHSRAIIHGAKASNTTLAHRFGVSTKTIAKCSNWNNVVELDKYG
jgi:hypothetical protein